MFIEKMRKNQKGFTLVELMVVVAIIGILSAIAIPNFKKYQAKSKTTEAKLALSGVYSAEEAFRADYNYYATCLAIMGVEENTTSSYYAIGFAGGVVPGDVATSLPSCTNAAGTFSFDGGKLVAGVTAAASGANLTTARAAAVVTAAGDGFEAGALGFIDADNATAVTGDLWTIDQDKLVVHQNVGY